MRKIVVGIVLIVAISLLFSISFAKTFSDVKNTKYADSVDFLSSLGIVDGYTDGTFKPNNNVTRAELCKLIIVSLAKTQTAESLKGDTTFKDVPANNWASGYINYASQFGIVKGYPDGTFKPSDPVSYVEAATMLLRALNYTKELESEKYPTGYMAKANSVGLLTNVSANSSSDKATRGNIANMVLNTLMANTRKIVSTTSKGTANYGDGSPLIEVSFSDYILVRNGNVIDVDFEDSQIVVRDKENDRKIRCNINGEAKLEELYNRIVDFLYDNNEKELKSFKIVDEYKVVEVNVDKIDEDDEILYDDKDKEYDLPDDILMVDVYNYEEVDTAYITYDDKKIVCMVFTGTPEIYAGIVTETGLTVEKRKGFELIDEKGKDKELALSDTSKKLAEGEFILYSLDNDGYAKIQECVARKNSSNIESLTTNSIKLVKEDEVSLKDDVEYYVYLIDLKDELVSAKLKDIDDEFDTAYITTYADVYYIIVFEDSVDDDDIVSKLSVSEAKELLEDTIREANKYLKKESSYSVTSYEELDEAVSAGKIALNSSSSAAKLELAERKIRDAIDNLEEAKSSDKQIRNDYDDLQDLIKEAEAKKSSDYTAESFKKLEDEIKLAKAVKLSNTTSAKISDRIQALQKAINMLVTNTANTEIQNAIKTLKNLIARGDNIVKSKSDFTEASYNKFYTVYTEAKKFDTNSASLAEIKNQASNLEAAIDNLEAKMLATYKNARKSLDSSYNDAKGRNKSDYTKDSFNTFLSTFETLEAQYKELAEPEDVYGLSNKEIQTETAKVTELDNKIRAAVKKLVTVTDDTTRSNLKALIEKGKTYTKDTWTNTTITFEDFTKKLTAAEKVANNSASTEQQLLDSFNDLIKYIKLT